MPLDRHRSRMPAEWLSAAQPNQTGLSNTITLDTNAVKSRM